MVNWASSEMIISSPRFTATTLQPYFARIFSSTNDFPIIFRLAITSTIHIASYAVIADATDEQALKDIGIKNFDHVIVAIGENIQASILTTVILSEMGVKKITVKAQNDYHEKILQKIGAHQVVHPERDMGRRLKHSFIS